MDSEFVSLDFDDRSEYIKVLRAAIKMRREEKITQADLDYQTGCKGLRNKLVAAATLKAIESYLEEQRGKDDGTDNE